MLNSKKPRRRRPFEIRFYTDLVGRGKLDKILLETKEKKQAFFDRIIDNEYFRIVGEVEKIQPTDQLVISKKFERIENLYNYGILGELNKLNSRIENVFGKYDESNKKLYFKEGFLEKRWKEIQNKLIREIKYSAGFSMLTVKMITRIFLFIVSTLKNVKVEQIVNEEKFQSIVRRLFVENERGIRQIYDGNLNEGIKKMAEYVINESVQLEKKKDNSWNGEIEEIVEKINKS